jgi:Fur family transcriptional regulator, ferric uptake regulator
MTVQPEQSSLPGKRSTAQRRLLLELIEKAQGHVDAGELYLQAREMESTISLSTVYRNLKLFKELGLVEERHFAEDHHHYEAKAKIEHYHLFCLGCGRVTEFVNPLVEQLKHEVCREHGFDVTDTEVNMSGYCSDCQRGVSLRGGEAGGGSSRGAGA